MNFVDQCIFVIGGRNMSDVSARLDLTSAEKYDVKRDVWTTAPSLCEPRMSHSSCALDDRFIYTFGGYNGKTLTLGSIERLRALDYLRGRKKERWTQVELKTKQRISSRMDPVVCPVSETEIAVLGGFNGGHLGTGYIFDTGLLRVRKVFDLKCGFRFDSVSNQSRMLRPGELVALVGDQNDELHMITYTKNDIEVRKVSQVSP